jgi:hypothetical protein
MFRGSNEQGSIPLGFWKHRNENLPFGSQLDGLRAEIQTPDSHMCTLHRLEQLCKGRQDRFHNRRVILLQACQRGTTRYRGARPDPQIQTAAVLKIPPIYGIDVPTGSHAL